MKRGQRQVFKLEKLQNHSDEGKGEEKKKERGEGKEEKRKKSMIALPVFITATFEIVFGRKNCWTQNVHLAITFSKIGLDIDNDGCKRPFCKYPPNSSHVLPLCFLFDFCCTFYRIK